jgi:hypothetical protein
MIEMSFAGVPTTNLEAALPWYEARLGRSPDVIVSDDELMWQIRDKSWLDLVRNLNRAGHALVTFAVSDLDQTLDEIAAQGLDVPGVETIEGARRKAPVVDPEGNTITFVHVLAPQ